MMFTKEQGQELIDNTTSEWVTIGDKNGRILYSKIDPYKYIYMAAGGEWSVNTSPGYSDRGYYWSTILLTSNAWHLYFTSNNTEMNHFYRYLGMPIRPVAPPKPW